MLRRLLVLALAGAMSVGLTPALLMATARADVAVAGEITPVPSNGTFMIEGHGWGHGHGMSQYGARGGAQLGNSGASIIAHYYPGTSPGTVPNALIRVRLLADNDSTTQVYPAPSGYTLSVTDLATNVRKTLPTGPDFWRTTVNAAGLHIEQHVGGAWQPWAFSTAPGLAGPVEFSGPPAIRLSLPGGISRDYRGTVRAVKLTSTTSSTVDVLPMESYLRGVVPRESPSSWEAHALEAQAIAARTYSESDRHPSSYYDICDTTACQVFGGSNLYDSTGKHAQEAASTDLAVKNTQGMIRTYNGAAIFAQFSASNGGWSSAGTQPYLVAQRDDWDGVPFGSSTTSNVHSWRATLTAAQVEAQFRDQGLGHLVSIEVTRRQGPTGGPEWGGRVTQVVLHGTDSSGAATTVTTTGAGIYNANPWGGGSSTGLRSSWWHVLVPSYIASLVSGPTSTGPATNPSSGPAGPVLADGHTVVVPVAGSLALSYVMRNAGNVDWPVSAGGPVRLATTTPTNRSSASSGPAWLVSGTRPSAITASGTAVAPGQTGGFGLTVYGNNLALGPTIEAFQPIWEAQHWISGATSTLRIVRVDPGQSRQATVESAPPAKVALTNAINGTTSLVVRLRNVGGDPWVVGSERLLAGATPLASGWASSTQPPALARNATRPSVSSVYPGEVGEWRVPISAFKKPAGSYGLTFRAATPAGVPYGPTMSSSVTVTQASFTGSVVAHAGSVRVPRNGTALTWFDVKNTGNVIWPVGGMLRSESLTGGGSPSHASSWLSVTRPAPLTLNVSRAGATDVRPGEVARFRFALAGNGRAVGPKSELFGAVWDGWTRMTGSRLTVSYQIV